MQWRTPAPTRRGLAVGVLALWTVVAMARLTELVERPAPPPGEPVEPFVAFARAAIPPDQGYLFLDSDIRREEGHSPRLRYELYPRPYEDLFYDLRVGDVRAWLSQNGLRYVVVPDATLYPPDHWVWTDESWYHRLALDRQRFILVVDEP